MHLLEEKLGTYTVNGVAYPNKITAVLEAQKTLSFVEWDFYDKVFSNFNWTKEPEGTLDDLYCRRAIQLREAYDYIVIRCSGGADSTNVLYSFLNNGIFPDEVVGESPMKALSNWKWNDRDTRMVNTVSEYKYTQMPLLSDIATRFPNVKVTHVDSSERLFNVAPNDWLVNCNDGIDAHAGVEGTMWNLKHLHQLAESGKTIAVISGTDKPYVTTSKNGNVFTSFVDLPLNYLKRPLRENFPNVHRVPFYWTPDFPEIACKMAHVVAARMFGPNRDNRLYSAMLAKTIDATLPPKMQMSADDVLTYLVNAPVPAYVPGHNLVYNPNNVYGRSVCPYIYPSTYNPDLFQAEKQNANQTFFGAQQDWFRILHGNSDALRVMSSDFANFYLQIHPMYLNSYKTGFNYYNQTYLIGTRDSFSN